MSDSTIQSRREFLRAMTVTGGALLAPASGGALASAATTAEATKLPGGLNPAYFEVHGLVPLTLESRRSTLGVSAITPESRFFVRNNLPMPPASIVAHAAAWELEVKGVARSTTITLAELQGLGLETEGAVIQCSGNGRAFFEHGPSGSNWGTGASGCAIWSGVRVRTLVEHLGGANADARFLTATGGEVLPDGMDRDALVVERSIPIEKGLGDALLAWEMNGAPISLLHGGPLRLIVPGYFGCNNIKYVKTLDCAPEESAAKIQQTGYRLRPIGAPSGSNYPSMWRMPVKSWVNGPGAQDSVALAGEVTFHGVALSGERGVESVEVSLDGGKTWQDARLDDLDLGPSAWRVFSFTTTLPVGSHSIASRATDTMGDVQPRERLENERGYAHNGWLDTTLTVTLVDELPVPPVAVSEEKPAPAAASGKPVELSEAGEAGKAVFLEAQPPCGTCHTLADAGVDGMVGPNLDALHPDSATVEAAVSGGVGAMPAYEHALSREEIEQLANYIQEATRRRP